MLNDDEVLKRTMALVSEIESQTDRGVAIIGVAWVEEELLSTIKSFLENDPKAWGRLFTGVGPLATFSAKIDLARLLGMCSETIASDLHRLRKIRNEFAHVVIENDHSALTFTSKHIADKCFALKCVSHENLTDPRHNFIRACAILNSGFYFHRFTGTKVSSGGLIYAESEYSI